jgi:hypothetical protein
LAVADWETRNASKMWTGKLQERTAWLDLGVDGFTALKSVFKNWDHRM